MLKLRDTRYVGRVVPRIGIVAGLLAGVLATACSTPGGSPVAPSGAVNAGSANAAADGSTLKIFAPEVIEPIDDVTTGRQPDLVAGSPDPRHTTGVDFLIQFHLYDPGGTLVTEALVARGTPNSTFTPPALLEYSTRYAWRARAYLDGEVGPWSTLTTFVVEDAPPPPPPPPPEAPDPGPEPGPGGGASCTGGALTPPQVRSIVQTVQPGPDPFDASHFRDRVLAAANSPNWGWHRRPNGHISDDIIAWNGPGGNPHWIFDIVSASTGPSPGRSWGDQTATIEPGSSFVPYCTPGLTLEGAQ